MLKPQELLKCTYNDNRNDNDVLSTKPCVHVRNVCEVTCVTELQNDERDENGYGDGETDLTNLTWLTELRCQNSLTWPPNAINPTLDADEKCMFSGNSDRNNKTRKSLSILGRDCYGYNDDGINQRDGANVVAKDIRYKNQKKSGPVQKRNQNISEQRDTEASSKNNQMKKPTPMERYEIFLDKVKRDLEEYEQFAVSYQTDMNDKPPFNYSHIIGMAMLQNGRVTLQQICSWIESKFAFFRVRKKWNNSIRHNLSLHHCFRKINRNKYEKGKGGYWELGLDPKKCDRKRIRNRKSGKIKVKSPPESKNNTLGEKTESLQHYSPEIQPTDVEYGPSNSQVIQPNSIGHQGDQQHKQIYVANIVPHCSENTNSIILSDSEISTCPETRDMPIPTASSVPHLQPQQYQFGTIIISTLSPDGANSVIPTFDCLINETFGDNIQSDQDETSQHISYNFNDEDMAHPCGNIIISSILTDSSADGTSIAHSLTSTDELHQNPNVVVEQLQPRSPCYMVSTALPSIIAPASAAASTFGSTSNCDYANIISDNFRPYIDGIEEAFQYLRSMDNNREDILDNLLDISVSDY